jgi:hypothetical protein
MGSVQGIPEIDASAEQAIIMKGVAVLRECRHTGCCKQCDAEDTAAHPIDNRKNHGTEYHYCLGGWPWAWNQAKLRSGA